MFSSSKNLSRRNVLRSGAAFGASLLYSSRVNSQVFIPVAPSLYTGQVMTGCRWPLFLAGGGQNYLNSQSPHFAVDSGNSIRIVLLNSYSGEGSASPGNITYTAAIWSASGSSLGSLLGVFKFAGATSGICASGSLLVSDWLSLNYTKGTQYLIRIFANGPSGVVFFQCPVGNSDTAHGALCEFGTSVLADKTQSGAAISPASFANSFCPIAVIGATNLPSILMLGDSLTCQGAAGKGDTFDGTSPRVGFPDRCLGTLGYAGINCGVPGETTASFNSNHSVRASLQQYVSRIWSNYGINDIGAGASAATTYSRLQSLWALFQSNTVVQGKISYELSSTDSFVTEANQSPVSPSFGPGGIVDVLNGLIAATAGINISDPRSASFDLSLNKWLANGVAFKYTPDGTHYSQFAAQALGTSGLVTSVLFS